MPAGNRSKFVADASAERSKAEETVLACACGIANASEAVRAIEQEFDAISADMQEAWSDPPAR
jgi:hypothetical protein